MDISLYDFVGNGIGNLDIADKVKKYLSEKYDNKFKVWKIGERYGTGEFTKAKIYCSLAENDLNIFTVIYDMIESKVIKDDFRLKSVCFELENDIYNLFEKLDIKSIIKIDVFTNNDIKDNCSLQDFLKINKNTRFLGSIILNKCISENKIIEILDIIKNKFNNLVFISDIYSINNENFYNLYDRIKNFPNISETILEEYEINKHNKITINNNQIIKIK